MIEGATNTIVVIPVKRFDEAKERLAGPVDPETRAKLAEAMLEDVLSALDESRMIFARIVVTSDDGAAAAATTRQARDAAMERVAGASQAAVSTRWRARALARATNCRRIGVSAPRSQTADSS